MKHLWLVALLATASSAAASDTRPSKQPEPRPCTSWSGRIAGNDPDVVIRARLCRKANGRVDGTITWRGRSGASVRTVAGTWSRAGLTLRDIRLEGTPNPGWRFCTIERYTLTAASPRKLAGSYRSSECRDDAAITLERE
ncbi:MAG: hypothetical protein WKG01_23475 [Kofleriaceae bacterium]